ncbi:hypothetical protein EC919_102431 [Pseudomonas graminis]|nr:hypothetical protein EC919_102431 [Pseudomonas graminis]
MRAFKMTPGLKTLPVSVLAIYKNTPKKYAVEP